MQKANKKYFLYKTRNFLSENRYIILAFLISAGILSLVYIVRRIYPFGGQTVLRVDLYHQYAPYIEELHSRILEGKSLIYSWEGGLGKDFVSQMAYYTASPFNLLMFLFPEKNLPEMIALFILLKISLKPAAMLNIWLRVLSLKAFCPFRPEKTLVLPRRNLNHSCHPVTELLMKLRMVQVMEENNGKET